MWKITYLNKERNFRPTEIYFNTYEDAVKWAMENLANYNPDCIQSVYKN